MKENVGINVEIKEAIKIGEELGVTARQAERLL